MTLGVTLGGKDDPVLIWGAGAVGGCLGAWMRRAGREVVFVDTDSEHVAAIRAHGLRVTGPVDAFTQRVPTFMPAELTGRYRCVILAVKAHHTEAASRALEPHLADDGFVVSAQNGLNERVIGSVVGPERVIGCFVNFGADVLEPGVVVRGNRGAVVVGEMNGQVTARVRTVHDLLREFEPDAVLTPNIGGYLWSKLAYGSLLFATALSDASIADVLAAEEHRPVLVELAREVMRVAAAVRVDPLPFDGFEPGAFGADAPNDDAHATLDALVRFNRASAKSHSGVWRDLAVRKRRTEVDAQIAPIAEEGAAAGVDTPTVRRLVELIHDVEEGRRPQSGETLAALGANLD